MKYRTKKDIFSVLTVFICGILAGTLLLKTAGAFWTNGQSLKPLDNTEITSLGTPYTMSSDEIKFYSTIRSCLGPSCFDYRAEVLTRDRVGLLGLPHSGISEIMEVIKSNPDIDRLNVDISLSTHVPCYGYGKNHGWTRIVRISRNVLAHAFSILSHDNGLSNSTTSEQIFEVQVIFNYIDHTLIDWLYINRIPYFSIQVRQLIRWHCRLSHVAAHTKLYTGNNQASHITKNIFAYHKNDSRI